MHVRVYDPHIDAGKLGEMGGLRLKRFFPNRILSYASRRTPDTSNLFDAAAFSRMKRGACFLNLSRGELVDEDALEAALDRGNLRGVGLDVGRAPDQKPSPRFIGRADVVAMPHVGGMTTQAREHQTMDTVHQIAALAAGEVPKGAVNPHEAHRLVRLGVVEPGAHREVAMSAAPWSAGDAPADCSFPQAVSIAIIMFTTTDFRMIRARSCGYPTRQCPTIGSYSGVSDYNATWWCSPRAMGSTIAAWSTRSGSSAPTREVSR